MTPHIGRVFVIVAMLAVAVASRAGAQAPPPRTNQWARGTELGVFAGAASGPSETGGTLAGTVGWEITRWVAIEGRGSWFDRGQGASGFSADLGALVNVVAKRNVTPFVGAGFGLYRASFAGPTSAMSDFYRGRMMRSGNGLMPAGRASFTDPAFRMGGGVDVIVARHWTIRPEAAALLVHREAQTEAVAIFGLRVGFRFEDHPVTPEIAPPQAR